WGELAHQSSPLGSRLPAGYVLPVVVQYIPPPHSPKIKGGPFYLRINGNCVANKLLNPDATYSASPMGPPWLKLYRDKYEPAAGTLSATYREGPLVDTFRPGTSLVAYLVLSEPPQEGSLKFELVAAPYGTAGYVPAVDTDVSVTLGPLVCSP